MVTKALRFYRQIQWRGHFELFQTVRMHAGGKKTPMVWMISPFHEGLKSQLTSLTRLAHQKSEITNQTGAMIETNVFSFNGNILLKSFPFTNRAKKSLSRTTSSCLRLPSWGHSRARLESKRRRPRFLSAERTLRRKLARGDNCQGSPVSLTPCECMGCAVSRSLR